MNFKILVKMGFQPISIFLFPPESINSRKKHVRWSLSGAYSGKKTNTRISLERSEKYVFMYIIQR